MKKLFLIPLLIVFGCLIIDGGAPAVSAPPIKIGHIRPLTGHMAIVGKRMVRAADFASGFSIPLDTQMLGNDVIVSSMNGVFRSSQGGNPTQVFTWSGSSPLIFFTSVEVDAGGDVFTVEWMTYQVFRLRDLNSDGDYLDAGESTVCISPALIPAAFDLSFDAAGDLYVADKSTREIVVRSAAGASDAQAT